MRWLPLALLLLVLGCRTTVAITTLEVAGVKIRCVERDTVIGTGSVDVKITNLCGTFASQSSETGFSEQAAPVLKNLTEGAAEGLSPL